MKTVVLITRQPVWEEAQSKGEYTQSTIDSALEKDEAGEFIEPEELKAAKGDI